MAPAVRRGYALIHSINLVPFIMVKADSAVGDKSLIRSPLPGIEIQPLLDERYHLRFWY